MTLLQWYAVAHAASGVAAGFVALAIRGGRAVLTADLAADSYDCERPSAEPAKGQDAETAEAHDAAERPADETAEPGHVFVEAGIRYYGPYPGRCVWPSCPEDAVLGDVYGYCARHIRVLRGEAATV